jgi:hemerythrin-like metal-binding protein
MALFEWNDTFSVNIEVLDEQHKHLVKLINDLYRSLLSNNPQEKMGDILDGMIEYASIHFQDEEAIMMEHDYPWYQSHKQKHYEFVNNALDYQKKFRSGEMKPSTEIVNFLKEWLKDHIMGADKEYSSYLNRRGVS